MATQPITPSLKPNEGYLPIKGMFSFTSTPGAITTGTTAIVTPTVPSYVKADVGDIVIMGHGADLAGIQVDAYVSAQNVIKVAYANVSAGTLTPPSAVCTIIIIPQEAGKFVA